MAPIYQIPTNIAEAQIEADVAAYLGWCSAGAPFRLIQVNEQLTGADKKLDVVMPIYMQFKKSNGLRQLTQIRKKRKNESKLQQIRRFRKRNGLFDNPTLYFGLRERAEQALDFQHNVLLSHHKPPKRYAIYVAPLHLDISCYYKALFSGPRDLENPYWLSRVQLYSDCDNLVWLSRFDVQPFLKAHISIPPHERVNSSNHYYAYSNAGNEVSWHSPDILNEGLYRLSDFMTQRVREALSGEYAQNPSEALRLALETAGGLGIQTDQVLTGRTPLEKLHNYGKWLNAEHGIRQFLLCWESEGKA